MQLAILGLNHNTAPVEIREKLSVAADKLPDMYSRLKSDPRVQEAVILSTCNRVEYYVVTDDIHSPVDVLYMIAVSCEVGVSMLRKHSYIHMGTDAIKHMVSVASGIDSLVLGEPQIFGQMKDAFRYSRDNSSISTYINRLEQFVLKTTKKVRTDTGIASNAVSVSYAAVDLAKKIFGTLENKKALIIGAGEMCELAAEHLAGGGIGKITVTNRTFGKAQELARRFYGNALKFDEFADHLYEADIIISSTGSPVAVVTAAMAKRAMAKRKHTPMFFIDIAVPRDIEPEVSNIENVYVYDIDDLKQVVEANRKARENEAVKAGELIKGAVVRFERSMEALAADPAITEIRSNASIAKNEELKRFCKRNNITDPEEIKKIDQMLESLVNKMLHAPTKSIKVLAADSRKYTVLEAALLLFNLKEAER